MNAFSNVFYFIFLSTRSFINYEKLWNKNKMVSESLLKIIIFKQVIHKHEIKKQNSIQYFNGLI